MQAQHDRREREENGKSPIKYRLTGFLFGILCQHNKYRHIFASHLITIFCFFTKFFFKLNKHKFQRIIKD
jgi:hypothetical protein